MGWLGVLGFFFSASLLIGQKSAFETFAGAAWKGASHHERPAGKCSISRVYEFRGLLWVVTVQGFRV